MNELYEGLLSLKDEERGEGGSGSFLFLCFA